MPEFIPHEMNIGMDSIGSHVITGIYRTVLEGWNSTFTDQESRQRLFGPRRFGQSGRVPNVKAKMIDIHAHVLSGIDDGAIDEEMSLNMMRLAVDLGIIDLITTASRIRRGTFPFGLIRLMASYIVSDAHRSEHCMTLGKARREFREEWSMENNLATFLRDKKKRRRRNPI